MAQHFLLTAEVRSMSLREIFEMVDDAAFEVFRKSRWGGANAMRSVVLIGSGVQPQSLIFFRFKY
jgi:hypothetical protein